MCSGVVRLYDHDYISSLPETLLERLYVCASATKMAHRLCSCLLLKFRNYHCAWLCIKNLMSSSPYARTGNAWRQFINISLLRGVSCLLSSYNLPDLSKKRSKDAMIFASSKSNTKSIHVSVFFSVSRLDYVSVNKRWRSRSCSRSQSFGLTLYVLFCLFGFVITTVHLTHTQARDHSMRPFGRWT